MQPAKRGGRVLVAQAPWPPRGYIYSGLDELAWGVHGGYDGGLGPIPVGSSTAGRTGKGRTGLRRLHSLWKICLTRWSPQSRTTAGFCEARCSSMSLFLRPDATRCHCRCSRHQALTRAEPPSKGASGVAGVRNLSPTPPHAPCTTYQFACTCGSGTSLPGVQLVSPVTVFW